jgi:SAM-dependent methyltransferase
MSASYAKQFRGSDDAYAAYYQNMNASMREKMAQASAHLPPHGIVLDMGSGSGQGSFDIANLYPDMRVIGIDISQQAVEHARGAYRLPNLSYDQGDIGSIDIAKESVHAIFNSSVLHHVTSFNGFSEQALEKCLDHQISLLAPGGMMIIRDFVRPELETMVVDLRCDDGKPGDGAESWSTWEAWVRYSKTVKNSRYTETQRPIWNDLGSEDGKWHRLSCSSWDINEFLLRKDYRKDWHVEMDEEYGYWTKDQFEQSMTRRGMRLVMAQPMTNPWIVKNRYEQTARIWNKHGLQSPFPATNIILVAQKPKPEQASSFAVASLTKKQNPSFLTLESWINDLGKRMDVISRPGTTIDILPWSQEGHRLFVGVRQGHPRPLAELSTKHLGTLDGSMRGGFVTECMSAMVHDGDDTASMVAARMPGVTNWHSPYLPSPGGIHEVVHPCDIQVDHRSTWEGLDNMTTIDATACLRACHAGGTVDARLENAIYRLLHATKTPPGPWIGQILEPVSMPQKHIPSPVHGSLFPFIRSTDSSGYMGIEEAIFYAKDRDGRVIDITSREIVRPVTSSHHTCIMAPVISDPNGEWYMGCEWRNLPSIQNSTGNPGFFAVPAWRLPPSITTCEESNAWMRMRSWDQYHIRLGNLLACGASFMPTPGITVEMAWPSVATIDPHASDMETLSWIPLSSPLLDTSPDGHTLTLMHRLRHMKAFTMHRCTPE